MDWTKDGENHTATVGMKITSRDKTTSIRLGQATVSIERIPGDGRPKYNGFVNGKLFEGGIAGQAKCKSTTLGPIIQAYINAARVLADLAGMADLPEPDLLVDGVSEGSGRRTTK